MLCLSFLANTVNAVPNSDSNYQVEQLITRNTASLDALYELSRKYGSAVLVVAARDGDLSLAQQLLEIGAPVNTSDTRKDTPLHQACRNGQKEMVELLLKNGAAVNVSNSKGWTPLHLAAGHGYREIAKLLLDKGAQVNVKDGGGFTPIYYAGSKGHKDLVSLLLTYVR